MPERVGEYLRGWKEYFRLADTPRIFDNLDRWIRRRLRALHLKHWGQQSTVYRELRARGMSKDAAMVVAVNCRRWWMNSGRMLHVALPNRYFVSDARPPSGESALKGAVLWRGSEDAISSTTPVVQAGAES